MHENKKQMQQVLIIVNQINTNLETHYHEACIHKSTAARYLIGMLTDRNK